MCETNVSASRFDFEESFSGVEPETEPEHEGIPPDLGSEHGPGTASWDQHVKSANNEERSVKK